MEKKQRTNGGAHIPQRTCVFASNVQVENLLHFQLLDETQRYVVTGLAQLQVEPVIREREDTVRRAAQGDDRLAAQRRERDRQGLVLALKVGVLGEQLRGVEVAYGLQAGRLVGALHLFALPHNIDRVHHQIPLGGHVLRERARSRDLAANNNEQRSSSYLLRYYFLRRYQRAESTHLGRDFVGDLLVAQDRSVLPPGTYHHRLSVITYKLRHVCMRFASLH